MAISARAYITFSLLTLCSLCLHFDQHLSSASTQKQHLLREHDQSSPRCDPPRELNLHGICECTEHRNFIPERNECACPRYAPFWNGEYCTGCPPGMDFNEYLNICYVCPDGYTRGLKMMTCQPALEKAYRVKNQRQSPLQRQINKINLTEFETQQSLGQGSDSNKTNSPATDSVEMFNPSDVPSMFAAASDRPKAEEAPSSSPPSSSQASSGSSSAPTPSQGFSESTLVSGTESSGLSDSSKAAESLSPEDSTVFSSEPFSLPASNFESTYPQTETAEDNTEVSPSNLMVQNSRLSNSGDGNTTIQNFQGETVPSPMAFPSASRPIEKKSPGIEPSAPISLPEEVQAQIQEIPPSIPPNQSGSQQLTPQEVTPQQVTISGGDQQIGTNSQNGGAEASQITPISAEMFLAPSEELTFQAAQTTPEREISEDQNQIQGVPGSQDATQIPTTESLESDDENVELSPQVSPQADEQVEVLPASQNMADENSLSAQEFAPIDFMADPDAQNQGQTEELPTEDGNVGATQNPEMVPFEQLTPIEATDAQGSEAVQQVFEPSEMPLQPEVEGDVQPQISE